MINGRSGRTVAYATVEVRLPWKIFRSLDGFTVLSSSTIPPSSGDNIEFTGFIGNAFLVGWLNFPKIINSAYIGT